MVDTEPGALKGEIPARPQAEPGKAKEDVMVEIEAIVDEEELKRQREKEKLELNPDESGGKYAEERRRNREAIQEMHRRSQEEAEERRLIEKVNLPGNKHQDDLPPEG